MSRLLPYVELAAYALVALLLWPSVRLAASALDDASQLAELSRTSFSHVLDVDRFGHLRPLKSALFWVLSRHPDWLVAWRGAALLLLLASARLWQLLCAALLKHDAWALLVALCWALNPTTASSLCWLSTANLVLAGLGVLAYLWLLDRDLAVGRSSWRSIAAQVCLLLAVLSHELALAAPLLVIFYRRCFAPTQAERRRSVVIALASVACVVALWLALYTLSASRSVDYRFASYPRSLLMLNGPRYLFENLRLWFWLRGGFGVLLPAAPAQQIWLGALLWAAFAGLGALLWRACARDGVLAFGALLCGSTLLPLTNLVPLGNTPVAMHYLYLPGLGLALLLVRASQKLRGSGWVRAAPLLLLMAAWLPEQRSVLAAWSDAGSLYAATIKNYPDNVEARVNLSAIYLDAKKYQEADALLTDSLRRAPNELALLLNRFKLLAETGRVDEALALCDAHPQLDLPNVAMVRGLLLLRAGRDAQASAAFERALELAVEPQDRLAAGQGQLLALLRMHDDARAQRVVEQLLAEFPDHAELRLLLRRP